MNKETGGQAFPKQQWEYDGQNNVLQYQEDGMTLRDYFAAKAFQAVIGSLNGPVIAEECKGDFKMYAKSAYKMADALLRVRRETSDD